MDGEVRFALREVEAKLEQMERLFAPDVKLTLIARKPGNPEGDVVLTMDSLVEVAALIERRRAVK